MRSRVLALVILAPLALSACVDQAATPTQPIAALSHMDQHPFAGSWQDEVYTFRPAVFDIDAAPDGSILVAENTTIREIRGGTVEDVGTIPAHPGSPINGLEMTGRGSFFATSGGLDLAAGAGVWHVSHGQASLVGDIEAFETAHDPDAFEGQKWKNQACEEDPAQGLSAGPQSNPYHLAQLTGSTVLVPDAAGNTLLSVSNSGAVDWVAVFTPPMDENGDWRILKTAENDPEIDCYVQPVPTSVAVGDDGAYYVGELTVHRRCRDGLASGVSSLVPVTSLARLTNAAFSPTVSPPSSMSLSVLKDPSMWLSTMPTAGSQ